MNIPDSVRLNEFGFYEITDKPTPDELRDYYAQRYYQEGLSTTYQAEYPPDELEHIEGKLRLRHHVVSEIRGAIGAGTDPRSDLDTATSRPSFLDIGCGEGWALAYFEKQGWDVLGLDFSSYSLTQFHPELQDRFRAGDLYEEVEKQVAEGTRFDVLQLDNVLEHVLDPAGLLRLCRSLIKPEGVLIVDVPNDFSVLQQHLLETGKIDRPFWVVYPDHLSYFNHDGLRNLARATQWTTARILGDQPIDFNLLNPATNYVMNREAGKAAHRARLEQDNLLLRHAPLNAVAAYYEGLAGVGLGRSIVAFLQPDQGVDS